MRTQTPSVEDRIVDRDFRNMAASPIRFLETILLSGPWPLVSRFPLPGCLLALVLLFIALPSMAEPVLIANPSVPATHLERNAARLLFSMRRAQWENGNPVRVYVLDDRNPLHVQFSREVLRIYPRQLRRVWDRQTFSGTGQAPNVVESVEEMHDKVAKEPGAIGYLPRELVDDHVKILEVQ